MTLLRRAEEEGGVVVGLVPGGVEAEEEVQGEAPLIITPVKAMDTDLEEAVATPTSEVGVVTEDEVEEGPMGDPHNKEGMGK